MDYYKYEFQTDITNNEVMIALLSTLPFDTFVESETGFEAFIPSVDINASTEEEIHELLPNFIFSLEKEFIKGENWNEVWETNFHPIQVDDFCGIRAHFHEPLKNVEHELIITPKMAFGTGHHETTHMVIQMMKDIDFKSQKVFDYGCGTGVLAIVASRLGAKSVDAIDIEEASWLSTMENCETNMVKNVNAFQGMLDVVQNRSYGIVLANINRNVILDSLATLSRMVEENGTVVFSGILKSDEAILKNALNEHGFTCTKTFERNKWIALQCQPV